MQQITSVEMNQIVGGEISADCATSAWVIVGVTAGALAGSFLGALGGGYLGYQVCKALQ